mmetsp:Transcript_3244/g.3087  ORF Transcript_3244/g.3087 Transcript_3244/m.3087 type:complete len:200 (-) Transcript_3244:97-696(-)
MMSSSTGRSNVIWRSVDTHLSLSLSLSRPVSLISMPTSLPRRRMLILLLKFFQLPLMKKTRRPSVFVPSRRTVFLTSILHTFSTRDPTLNGLLLLISFLPLPLESSSVHPLSSTMEMTSPLSRWTEPLITFRNLLTSNLPSRTLTPNSMESSPKLCLLSLMPQDPTTELVLCKQWPLSPSVIFTRRRLPMPNLTPLLNF